MSKDQKIMLIKGAMCELALLIKKHNDELKRKILPTDLDEPDYLDYQSCGDLQLVAMAIENDNQHTRNTKQMATRYLYTVGGVHACL